jgi:hypothetical protein
MGVPLAESTGHFYLSTACLHAVNDPSLHEYCRLRCKFCDAPCQCRCHGENRPTPSPDTDTTAW